MGKHRDWSEIEKDYQEGDLNYNQIAEKYDISISTLKKAAARQGWTRRKERKAKKKGEVATRVLDALEASLQNGTIQNGTTQNGTIENGTANGTNEMAPVIPLYPDRIYPAEDDATRFRRIVDMLMDRVEDAICQMDVTQTGSVKLMTGALKDLRSLKGMDKSALDIEEQKARIEKLKSEARVVEDIGDYGVIFLPEIEEVHPPA